MMQPTEPLEPTLNPDEEAYQQILEEIDQFGEAKQQYVTDEVKAGWAFQKLAELNRDDAKDRKKNQAVIDQANAWLNARIEKRTKFRDFLEHELLTYSANQREKDPKYRLDTPFGKVQITKKRTASPKITDPTQVLEFVKSNWNPHLQDEAIKRTEKVQISGLKHFVKVAGDKVVDEDGQVIPGMGVDPAGSETAKVKPTPIVEV